VGATQRREELDQLGVAAGIGIVAKLGSTGVRSPTSRAPSASKATRGANAYRTSVLST